MILARQICAQQKGKQRAGKDSFHNRFGCKKLSAGLPAKEAEYRGGSGLNKFEICRQSRIAQDCGMLLFLSGFSGRKFSWKMDFSVLSTQNVGVGHRCRQKNPQNFHLGHSGYLSRALNNRREEQRHVAQ